jgi:hypothetical protein
VTFDAFREDKADPSPTNVSTPVVTYIGDADILGGHPQPLPFPTESCIYYIFLKKK